MSFAAMIGRRRQLVVPTLPDPEEPPPTDGEPFFFETFAGGQRNNANGFEWLGAVEPVVATDFGRSDSNSLRFTLNANGADVPSFSEERFDMGRYLDRVAIEQWVHLPSNWKHRNTSYPGNNKFLFFWRNRDDYTQEARDWQVGVEWWRTNDFESWGRFMSNAPDQGFLSNQLPPPNDPPFIGAAAPLKPGQWNRFRLYVQAASSRSASDGVYKVWANDTQLVNLTNKALHNPSSDPVGALLRHGYLMGYMNSGFDETTVIHVDDVAFFDHLPSSWSAT